MTPADREALRAAAQGACTSNVNRGWVQLRADEVLALDAFASAETARAEALKQERNNVETNAEREINALHEKYETALAASRKLAEELAGALDPFACVLSHETDPLQHGARAARVLAAYREHTRGSDAAEAGAGAAEEGE